MRLKLVNGMVLSVLDGTMSQVSLLIEDNRIRHMTTDKQEALAWDAKALDMTGHWLLPGLIDAHVHPGGMIPDPYNISPFEREAERTLRALRNVQDALQVGFTTLRALGDASYIDISIRDGISHGVVMGPRIVACGKCIRCTGGHGSNGKIQALYVEEARDADGPDDVMRAVREQIRAGADQIKLLITGGIAGIRENPDESQMTFEEIKAAVDVAHGKGFKVSVHAGDAKAIKTAILAGVDSIEHGYHLDDEGIAMMVDKGVWYVPTISVTQDTAYMKQQNWPTRMVERALATGEAHLRAFKSALKAGVKIANGSDKNPIAEAAPVELEVAVKSGMTTLQAIQASTIKAADLCDMSGEIGDIKPGMIADLLVLQANPLEDISAIRKISTVIKNGEVVKAL